MDWFTEYYKASENIKDLGEEWDKFKQGVNKLSTKPKSKPKTPSFSASSARTKFINYEQKPSHSKTTVTDKFDKKIKRKINKNLFLIHSILDLHGLSLLEAEKKVISFIIKSFNESKSLILIITGKGIGSDSKTTIQQLFPSFLRDENIAHLIKSYTHASEKHGGSGAYYVLLKKPIVIK